MKKIKINPTYFLAIYTFTVLTCCPIASAIGDEQTHEILSSLDQLMARNLEKLNLLSEKLKNDKPNPDHLQIIKRQDEEIKERDIEIERLEEQLRRARIQIRTLQGIVDTLCHDNDNQVRLRQQIAKQQKQIMQQKLELEENREELAACQEALQLKAIRDAEIKEKNRHLIDAFLNSHTEDAT